MNSAKHSLKMHLYLWVNKKIIEMVLSEIKLKPNDLSDAIMEYNEDLLTKDIINNYNAYKYRI